MRKVKFRAKDIYTNEFVYGYYFVGASDTHWIVDENCVFKFVNGKTVGQFTGLFDKNGKEIYEGDILDSHLYELCVVEYDEFGTFSPFGHGDYAEISTWLKIIGNIHDNKDLLDD